MKGKKIVGQRARYFNSTRKTTLGIAHGKTSTELNKAQVITDAASVITCEWGLSRRDGSASRATCI